MTIWTDRVDGNVKVLVHTPNQVEHLDFVDEEVREQFAGKSGYFNFEPLLMQLIIELRKANKGDRG